MDDEDRDAILRRRNRFMSLALVGVASLGCDEEQAEEPTSPPVQMSPVPQAVEPTEPAPELEEEPVVTEAAEIEELTEAQRRKRRAERAASMTTPSAQPVVCLWFKP